jgi:hypothetical protein
MNDIKFKTYFINSTLYENGVEICDGTNGSVQIKETKNNQYEITINNKILIFPTNTKASDGTVFFSNSKKITFTQEINNDEVTLIKITEIDSEDTNIFYVDPNNTPLDDIAYDLYNYKPEKIKMESAIEKIIKLVKENKVFKADILMYNRHGIAAFGWDTNEKKYALYYGNPQCEKLEKTECSDNIHRFRDGGTSTAKSDNGFVNFHYQFAYENQTYYLNGEVAENILLEIIENEMNKE